MIRKAFDWLSEHWGFRSGRFERLYLSPGYSLKPVTARSALQTVAVLRCVTLIAGAGGSLPIDIFEKLPDGRRRPLEGHPLEDLLNRAPNPEMSAMDFRAMMWAHMLLWGNAYALIVRNLAGEIIALWPLSPELVEPDRSTAGALIYKYGRAGGQPMIYLAEEIFHLRWFSLDGVVGLSAVGQARQAIALNQGAEEFAGRYLASAMRPSAVIEYPQALSPKAIENIRRSFEETYGGLEHAHRVVVLEQGAKLSPFSVNPRDSQFLEQRNFSDEQIAMLFGLPPHMLGLTNKTTSWGAGIAAQKQGFLDFTLAPLLTFWEKAIERTLLTPPLYCRHNTSAFLRADVEARYRAYVSAVNNGLLSRNEARALEDRNPFSGGDTYTVQAQMVPLPERRSEHASDSGA